VQQQRDRDRVLAERAVLGEGTATGPLRLVAIDPQLDLVRRRSTHRGEDALVADGPQLHPSLPQVADPAAVHRRAREVRHLGAGQ